MEKKLKMLHFGHFWHRVPYMIIDFSFFLGGGDTKMYKVSREKNEKKCKKKMHLD